MNEHKQYALDELEKAINAPDFATSLEHTANALIYYAHGQQAKPCLALALLKEAVLAETEERHHNRITEAWRAIAKEKAEAN